MGIPDFQWFKVNVLFPLGVVGGAVGQAVSLEYFLSPQTLPGNVGPYFVLLSCSIFFTVFFGVISAVQVLFGQLTQKSIDYAFSPSGFKLLVLLGVFDAMNGVLVVFASLPWHVPSVYQTVLQQSQVPFNLILTKMVLTRDKYNWSQLFGAFITVLGIVLSLTPDLREGKDFPSGSWWILIMVGASIPGVAMNVFEERIFDEFREMNIYLILFVESFFQLLSMLALFWVDLLPMFGYHGYDPEASKFTKGDVDYHGDISDWRDGVKSGFECVFTPDKVGSGCDMAGVYWLIFCLSYSATYIFNSYLFRNATSNFNVIVTSLSTPISTLFWVAFPRENLFVGNHPIRALTWHWIVATLPVVFLGIAIYRYNEPEKKTRDGYDAIN